MAKSEKKVLIVEDEAPLRELLIKELNREGVQALGARDGDDGLAVSFKEHPDLILLDILMPKKDGLEMLKELRRDSWGNGVEVVLLTNLNESDKIFAALEQGAREYLVKSDWKIEDVIAMVKKKLGV